MKRLILIRHSLPQIEKDKPSRSWTLSPEGEARAATMAVAVAALNPASVFASAEEKATRTAEFITGITGLTLGIDPGFNEQERSEEPFTGKEDFERRVSEALRNPDELHFGSETVSEAVQRFHTAVLDAERFSQPGDIAVVSHGTVISAYVASRVGADPVEIWNSIGMPGFICLNWPDPDTIELSKNFD